MKGKIVSIIPDEKYEFKGEILAEDGTTYRFNKWNWYKNRELPLSLDNVNVGDIVVFELKAPNQRGFVYLQDIRFEETEIDTPSCSNNYETNHSKGQFQDFVYLNTSALLPLFKQLSDDFHAEEYTEKSLYRQIATHYNQLYDTDFICPAENDQKIILFPSGFHKGNNDIYLYCIENDIPNKSKWICNKVFYKDRILGMTVLHDLVKADWYDILSNLKIENLLPKLSDNVNQMVQKIELRCMDADKSLIWLKNGIKSTKNDANHLYVPTGYRLEIEDKELYLYCSQRNGVKGYGWYFDCITYEGAPLDIYDKKYWLELWSEFNWETIYSQIVNQTLDEQWSFGKRADYGILRNYLIYTFAHQWKSSAVGFSTDKKYAAFNTGLPDRNTYKYIYAFYEVIPDATRNETHALHITPQYRFKNFVVSDRGGDGKTLKTNIYPLPNPPQYFVARNSTVWELDFNDNNQITMPGYDDTHILIQRCDRLPLDFYRYHAFRSERLRNILDSGNDNAQKYQAIREFFMPIVNKEPDNEVTQAYRQLVNALDNVISSAIKKLSWNWRAVVPCYNPEREETCFLLPVSFCDLFKPDRAMIASAHKNDNGEMIYAIHTVISLEWAYLDARLVCRPESEWLAPDNIVVD